MQTPPAVHEPAATDDEWVWDEDTEPSENDAPTELRSRAMPSVHILACLTLLGFGLALGYRYAGLQPWWPFKPSQATAQAAPATATTPPAADSELARTVRELDALKKTVGDLTAANQQLAAAVTALKAGQQDLQQRIASAQFQGWHSVTPVMTFRIVAVSPKDTTGSIAPHASTGRTVAARPTKPAANAPLQLTAPQH